jgi:hypothetical protein
VFDSTSERLRDLTICLGIQDRKRLVLQVEVVIVDVFGDEIRLVLELRPRRVPPDGAGETRQEILTSKRGERSFAGPRSRCSQENQLDEA